jgi:hypothetical protein
MPLKTWTDKERLEAADLNAAFAWSQELTLPGAWAAGSGSDVGNITSGQYKTIPLGPPAAGQDPLGIWQSDGRLLIPAGWGGIWTLTISGDCNTVTAGAGYRVYCTGMGSGGRTTIGGGTDAVASTSSFGVSYTGPAIAGASVFVELSPQNSDSTVGMIRAWSIIRHGRGLGAPGAVALASTLEALSDDLEALPAPPEVE